MKLTTKQSALVNQCNDPDFPSDNRDKHYRWGVDAFNKRAYPCSDKDIYIRRGIYFPSTYPDTNVSFTDLHGSGMHRTARSLEKLGIGRVFYIRPLDESFFKLI